MRHQHHRRGDAGRADERVEIGDRVGGRPRLRHRIAAARRLAYRRSRPVVGADPGELPDRGEDVRRTGRGFGPVGRRRLGARDDDDGRRPVALAFDIHFAAVADINGTCGIRGRGGRRSGRRGAGRRGGAYGRAFSLLAAGAATCQKARPAGEKSGGCRRIWLSAGSGMPRVPRPLDAQRDCGYLARHRAISSAVERFVPSKMSQVRFPASPTTNATVDLDAGAARLRHSPERSGPPGCDN